MPLTQFGTMRFPSHNSIRSPDLDASGAVVPVPADGSSPAEVLGVTVHAYAIDSRLRTTEDFSLEDAESMSWSVTLTDYRIFGTAPQIVGLFGGPKLKSNKITAGSLNLAWISAINVTGASITFATPSRRTPNGEWAEAVSIGFDSKPRLQQFGHAVRSRLVTRWASEGVDTLALDTHLSEAIEVGGFVSLEELIGRLVEAPGGT